MYSTSIACARTLPHCTHTKSSGPLPENTGRSGSSCTAVPPSGGTSPGRTLRMVTVAIAVASERGELPGEVVDQRVEHSGDDALSHRRRLARDLRVGVHRALAVVDGEGHVGVRVAVPPLLLGAHAQDGTGRGFILLDHLDRARERHRH